MQTPQLQSNGFLTWVKGLFRRDRLVFTLIDSGGILGLMMTGLEVLREWGDWFDRVDGGEFKTYLWFTFVIVTLTPVAILAVYAAFRRDHAEMQRREAVRSKESTTLHLMAEAVRRAVANPQGFDLSRGLANAMNSLRELLQDKLGTNVSITVKYQESPGSDRLVVAYRDPGQDPEKRKIGDSITTNESPVYQRFFLTSTHNGNPKNKKVVYIHDTQKVPGTEDTFRRRAEDCGYHTVIGFPLRVPEEGLPQGLNAASLIGFLSFDAPRIGSFESLLRPMNKDIRDDDREPASDLEVFYGVADALATIVMLKSGAFPSRGNERKGETEK